MKSRLFSSSVTPNGLNGLLASMSMASRTGVMPAATPTPNGRGAARFLDLRLFQMPLTENLMSSAS
jgi:hypothetical protein